MGIIEIIQALYKESEMSHAELKETLIAIGRLPGEGRRDTCMLLSALDRVQEIKRELSQAIYDSEKDSD